MKLVFHDASFQGDVNDIHEKMQYLVEYFCAGNKASFSREAGIPTAVIASITGGRKSKPSFDILQKILNRFPVNANWLITGKGPVLTTDDTVQPTTSPVVDNKLVVQLHQKTQELADYRQTLELLERKYLKMMRQESDMEAESVEGRASHKEREMLQAIGSDIMQMAQQIHHLRIEIQVTTQSLVHLQKQYIDSLSSNGQVAGSEPSIK